MNKNISILLPVKNGGKYIKKSLTNLIQISQVTDEILVIDDFSTDRTKEIVLSEINSNSRVRYLTNVSPGLVSALNFGIKEAKNEWIARADVDDQYEINRLIEQRNHIATNTVGIFTDYDFFSDSSKYMGTIPSAIEANAVSVSLISSQRTAHPSILFNKDAVINAGGYREIDFPAEDLSLWLRMSRLGDLISIPKTLLHYRLSKGSISGTRRVEANEMTKKLLNEIGINQKNIVGLIENFAPVIQLYKDHSYSKERELLLLRDLYFLSKNTNIENKTKKQINQLLLRIAPDYAFSFSSFRALRLLHKEQSFRNKVRSKKL
jgi:glycosyltransferase involved in cell wall biosynthesis